MWPRTIELLAVCADKECSALQGGTRGADFIDLWDGGRERRRLMEGVGRGFSGMEGAHRRRGRRCCVLSRPACNSDFPPASGVWAGAFPFSEALPQSRRVAAPA
jgi:hypothetical protein